ncbi:hypothetical protein EV383_4139 [Pseudonocardia sediminis]|uniref:Metal-dependent hydrolase n=1 Tax=Pseudonocardia sediminis TaxID=1397368 RepID=A0A4Q7V3Q7_PSEST|nr:metal-dependent hydrolase [Pseudonocardia sediminis]RZT87229.1 hypothetical protein EV383_4139 [Pseudonocardia sediminis]
MTDTAPRPRRLQGADVGIPPRQLDFRLPDALAPWAYADNATATLFLAMLSAIFPPGEDFFVRSVVAFRDRVTDEELRAKVAGFTAQEVIHSREHDRLNAAFRDRGFPVGVPEKAVATALKILERTSPRQQLACTALMEHFTAVLAEDILGSDEFGRRVHGDIAELWLWHALEELEHKSVTYDVYEVIGTDQAERDRAVPLVLATVGVAALFGWGYLLVQQGIWRRPSDLREGWRLMFGPGQFMRRVLTRMPVFNHPRFHPDKHDTRALEQQWREILFGEDGSLTEQLRRPARRGSA